MIRGVGIDLIEVARIRAAAERFGDRFLNRILRPAELAYCRSFKDPAPHLAARFAAKEAVSKAFGTGIGAALGWQDLEVANRESGQPYLILHDGGGRLLAQGGGGEIHLSLSHTDNYATAVAVWDQP
jgi:holo-[acyl-carrier protein] synthase